jgi:hypothetical protein
VFFSLIFKLRNKVFFSVFILVLEKEQKGLKYLFEIQTYWNKASVCVEFRKNFENICVNKFFLKIFHLFANFFFES